MNSENGQGGAAKLTRNNTAISLADTGGSRSRTSFAGGGFKGSAAEKNFIMLNENLTYLDSPATTNAITYGVTVSSITSGTFVNRLQDDTTDSADRLRSISYITAMEIAV